MQTKALTSHIRQSRTLSVDASPLSFFLSFARSLWHSIFGYEKFDRDLTQQQQNWKTKTKKDTTSQSISFVRSDDHVCVHWNTYRNAQTPITFTSIGTSYTAAVFDLYVPFIWNATRVYIYPKSLAFAVPALNYSIMNFMRIHAQFSMFANRCEHNAHEKWQWRPKGPSCHFEFRVAVAKSHINRNDKDCNQRNVCLWQLKSSLTKSASISICAHLYVQNST